MKLGKLIGENIVKLKCVESYCFDNMVSCNNVLKLLKMMFFFFCRKILIVDVNDFYDNLEINILELGVYSFLKKRYIIFSFDLDSEDNEKEFDGWWVILMIKWIIIILVDI